MSTPLPRKEIQLSGPDIDLIVKALMLYDRHVTLLNSDIFKVAEDDLSEMNNDCEYAKGLIRQLELYREGGRAQGDVGQG